jgi:hypothetical protein
MLKVAGRFDELIEKLLTTKKPPGECPTPTNGGRGA